MARKKKVKLSAKELMEAVVDKEALKANSEKKTKQKEENVEQIKQDKENESFNDIWLAKDFKKYKFENEFYARHKDWHGYTFIGGYETKKELEDVIQQYEVETQKPILERKFKYRIKSIIIKDISLFKEIK